MPEFANGPKGISQLEGLRKGPIAPDALPFVQDFIKNPPSGKPWAYVDDAVLDHTEMVDVTHLVPKEQTKAAKVFPGQRYITERDLLALFPRKSLAD